jgi:HlyD family secretion protein
MKSLLNGFHTFRKLILVVAAVLLLAGAGYGLWQWRYGNGKTVVFKTEEVKRGQLVATINSTGTLVPEEVIDVGAQVAGKIEKFGKDIENSQKPTDYRSKVEKGTVLAYIDDTLYVADVNIAKANLRVSDADVRKAEKDLDSAKAKVDQRKQDLESAQANRDLWTKNLARDTQAYTRGALDKASLDATRGQVGVYQAAVASARAGIVDAEAAVASAEASLERAKKMVIYNKESLDKAEKNLAYCTITSPVKGEIVDRRVNIGQTVVASLTAPSLFLIAKDLKRMQIWATVNEADISRIRTGQTAYFKVDTYPQEVFHGIVSQIRFNATMTNNVVTYTVVVDTKNDDMKLIPYLTTNLQFRVDQRAAALLLPNSALRYRPAPERVAPEYREKYQRRQQRRPMAPVIQPVDAKTKARQNRALVWVEDNGFVRPVEIRTGLTDGVHTEVAAVLDGELPEGAQVVTGEQQGRGGGNANPFAPKLFSGPKKE